MVDREAWPCPSSLLHVWSMAGCSGTECQLYMCNGGGCVGCGGGVVAGGGGLTVELSVQRAVVCVRTRCTALAKAVCMRHMVVWWEGGV